MPAAHREHRDGPTPLRPARGRVRRVLRAPAPANRATASGRERGGRPRVRHPRRLRRRSPLRRSRGDAEPAGQRARHRRHHGDRRLARRCGDGRRAVDDPRPPPRPVPPRHRQPRDRRPSHWTSPGTARISPSVSAPIGWCSDRGSGCARPGRSRARSTSSASDASTASRSRPAAARLRATHRPRSTSDRCCPAGCARCSPCCWSWRSGRARSAPATCGGRTVTRRNRSPLRSSTRTGTASSTRRATR